jgi:hypothetical protein
MTQVLHLYVAAYQKKDVWKLCWKRIYPIMSTQISKVNFCFYSHLDLKTNINLLFFRM